MAQEDIKTIQAVVLAGPLKKPTQIIVSFFSNLLFVIITQTGQVGTFVSSDAQSMDAKILLGDRTDLIPSVYANEIVRNCIVHINKNVFRFSLGE
jgi:hypothetical protein